MIDKEYWHNLLVNIKTISTDWNKGKKHSNKLELHLRDYDNLLKRKAFAFIMPELEIKDDYDLDNHYYKLLSQDKAKVFYSLIYFYRGKQLVIEEYVNNNSTTFRPFEIDNLFFALLKIYDEKPKELLIFLLMSIWNSKNIDETFLYYPKINDLKLIEFKDNMVSFVLSLKKKTKSKYDFKGIYSFEDNNIFWFEKQKSDKIQRAFLKNITFKPAYDILFNLQLKENRIEIKCKNNSICNALIYILSNRLNIQIVPYLDEIGTQIDNSKFKIALTTVKPNNDELGISEIVFNQLAIAYSSPMILPKRSGRDIRKTLSVLNQEKIIDLNKINSIDHIKILYKGSDKKIIFFQNKDGTIILKLETKKLSNSDIKEIKNKFERQFGIPLDSVIKEKDVKKIKQDTLNLIFNSEIIDRVSNTIKNELEELKNKGLLTFTSPKIYICPICRKTFHELKDCPDCGNDLKEILSKVKISKNEKNILKLLNKRFKDNDFNVSTGLVTRTYRNKKKFFVELKTKETIVYVYYNSGKNIDNIIEYFKHSIIPIIIINSSQNKIKKFDEKLFPQIELSKVLMFDDTEFKKYFVEKQKQIMSNIEKLIFDASENSKDRLNRFLNNQFPEYDSSMLEDDTFNLMRYIFKTGEKWGKSKSGYTVPEGIVGYGFLKKYGAKWNTHLKSIIWDCKFTNGSAYDFSRTTKVQAKDYVLRTSQSNAIKKYSTQLSAYINFTNAYNETQYNNFAKTIKKIKNWKGDVVLFELNALIKLYQLMKDNYTKIDSRRSQFYYMFSNLFKKNKEHMEFTIITVEMIENLVSGVLSKDEDISQLNYNDVFLHLKRDEIIL